MYKHFFSHVDVKPTNINILNGNAPDLRVECAAYEEKIRNAGGIELFLGGEAAPNTVATLQKQLDDPQVVKARLDDPVKQADLAIVTGLVLGAPEFQRR